MSSTSAVLAAIDDTLAEYGGTVTDDPLSDAMRWSPARVICDGGKPLRITRHAIGRLIISPAEAEQVMRAAATFGQRYADAFTAMLPAIRKFGEALAAATGQSRRLACSLMPRSHRPRCRECNPHGNPFPLAINGREYRRRQLARKRRR